MARNNSAVSSAYSSGTQPRHSSAAHGQPVIVEAHSLRFTREKGGNGSGEAYQDAEGAPVETQSPLGYSVGPLTIIFLNLSKMVGTGVYSTPASILKNTGSVGLSLLYWFIGFLVALATLAVYLEFASYFPNRSGSEAVYLEQAYRRPKYLFPITFAAQTVLLSFASSNAIVMAQYLFRIGKSVPTAWELKGTAIACYTAATLLLLFNTRVSYWVSNGIGAVKLITLIFVAITGLVVLGGHTSVPDPTHNFHDAFAGTTTSGYGLVNAMIKIVFSYSGYENAFNVVNEVKHPVQAMRIYATISLFLVGVLYMLANIAYFAAIPKLELEESSQIAASLFFQKVFGSSNVARGLNFLIALSAFGNLIAVQLGQSRLIRECGRQGALPFPEFWVSTKPFGTTLGPFLFKFSITTLVILAVPAGDAFNFVVDVAVYPASIFGFIMALGLYLVRQRRRLLGIGRSSFCAWHVAILFMMAANLFMVVGPWYPPAKGRYAGDVSFWYATYVVTAIALLGFCVAYYVVWVYILPRIKGYELRQERLILENGEGTHRLVKVPRSELEKWDRTHDATGGEIQSEMSSEAGDGVAYIHETRKA